MNSFGNYYLDFGYEFPPYPITYPPTFDYCKKNCFMFTEKGITDEVKLILNLHLTKKEPQSTVFMKS